MKIEQKFKEQSVVFSFEVFPPKREQSIDTIYNTLDGLCDLNPDFISVTYGAGGKKSSLITADIAGIIKEKYQIEPMAHLTCVNSTKEDVRFVLHKLEEKEIHNILALRGDINPDMEPRKEFQYAKDLIQFIKEQGNYHIAAACYPEGHPEANSFEEDLCHLKQKVEVGAKHLVSQLFFNNEDFYSFVHKSRERGITVPIEAGIMPVVNKSQIERMVTLCGASLPPKFVKMMSRFEHNKEALTDAGIAYATEQIVDLIAHGVDGIHLYTMNNPYVARRISENIKELRKG